DRGKEADRNSDKQRHKRDENRTPEERQQPELAIAAADTAGRGKTGIPDGPEEEVRRIDGLEEVKRLEKNRKYNSRRWENGHRRSGYETKQHHLLDSVTSTNTRCNPAPGIEKAARGNCSDEDCEQRLRDRAIFVHRSGCIHHVGLNAGTKQNAFPEEERG